MKIITLLPPSFVTGGFYDGNDAQNNLFYISVSVYAGYRAAVYAQELYEFPRALAFGLWPWYDKQKAECFSHEIMVQAAGLLYGVDTEAYRHENSFSVAGYDYVHIGQEACEKEMKSRSTEALAWVQKHLDKIKKAM